MSRPSPSLASLPALLGLALALTAACTDDSANEGGETSDSFTGDGDPTTDSTNPTNGDGDGDGDSGSGDGDGDGDGDSGSGDGDGQNENPPPPPGCGDGMLDPGEACDDGNNIAGDGCSVLCQLPGELLWELEIDLDPDVDDVGLEVVVDAQGQLGVLVDSGLVNQTLLALDAGGAELWQDDALLYDRPNLSVGPAGELAIAGRLGSQATVRVWDRDGGTLITGLLDTEDSGFLGAGFDDQGFVTVSGYHGENGALARFDPIDVETWQQTQDVAGRLGPLALGPGGAIWTTRDLSAELERYTAEGAPSWTAGPLAGDIIEELGLDAQAAAYALASRADLSGFDLTRVASDGQLGWSLAHGEPGASEHARGLLVSAGGFVIVGSANADADALLSWVSLDGALLTDVILDDGEVEQLHSITATGPVYAVAVGTRAGALWVRKFEY